MSGQAATEVIDERRKYELLANVYRIAAQHENIFVEEYDPISKCYHEAEAQAEMSHVN